MKGLRPDAGAGVVVVVEEREGAGVEEGIAKAA